ncbi:MAG: hypothetical protein FJ333_03205 [Sphingomonadales bacterium]|nr:hypothetical protein [Sphingomonadales bacterium]
MAIAVMSLSSVELRNGDMSIFHFTQESIRERLAEVFLFLHETNVLESNGKTIDLKSARWFG